MKITQFQTMTQGLVNPNTRGETNYKEVLMYLFGVQEGESLFLTDLYALEAQKHQENPRNTLHGGHSGAGAGKQV